MEHRDRVLFIVNSFAGGGAEKVCLNLMEELAKTHEVEVVTLYQNDDYNPAELSGISTYSLGIDPDCPNMTKLLSVVRAVRRFNAYLKEREQRTGRYKLISAHLTASHALARFSIIADRCLYVHHAIPSAVGQKGIASNRFMLSQLYAKGLSVCVGQGVKEELVKSGIVEAGRATVIQNPVPGELIAARANSQTSCCKRPFILFAGRLISLKHPERALHAYVRGGFCKTHDLCYLGQGPLEEPLRKEASELGVSEHVHFEGFVPNPFPWMRQSSAQLLTSDWEAFPMAVIEGLIAGAHVVSADCDYGPREIMTGNLAEYLVNPSDIDAYVAGINRALEEYPPLPEGFVERFSARNIAELYLNDYEEAFGGQA